MIFTLDDGLVLDALSKSHHAHLTFLHTSFQVHISPPQVLLPAGVQYLVKDFEVDASALGGAPCRVTLVEVDADDPLCS